MSSTDRAAIESIVLSLAAKYAPRGKTISTYSSLEIDCNMDGETFLDFVLDVQDSAPRHKGAGTIPLAQAQRWVTVQDVIDYIFTWNSYFA